MHGAILERCARSEMPRANVILKMKSEVAAASESLQESVAAFCAGGGQPRTSAEVPFRRWSELRVDQSCSYGRDREPRLL